MLQLLEGEEGLLGETLGVELVDDGLVIHMRVATKYYIF